VIVFLGTGQNIVREDEPPPDEGIADASSAIDAAINQ
jgi:hypothetical protein